MRLSTKNPLFWAWLAYGTFLIYGTLIPFDLVSLPKTFPQVVQNFFLNGLILSLHISKMDLLSNFVLFVPFGFLTAGALLRGGKSLMLAICVSLAASPLLSLGVELCQAYSPSRVSSLLDVFLNGFGGAFGTLIAAIFFQLFYERTQKIWNAFMQEQPILLATFIFGFLLFLGGLIPFDVSLQISDLKTAIKNIQWIPFAPIGPTNAYYANLSTDFLLFTAFAGLCHFSLRLYSVRCRSFLFPTIALTIALAGGIEFSQLFIVSRSTDTTHLILGFLAGLLGSLVASTIEQVLLHQTQTRASPLLYFKLVLIFLYSVGTAYLLIAPVNFHFAWEEARAHLSLHELVPFYAYWLRTDFDSLHTSIFKLLIYVPLAGMIYSLLRPIAFPRFFTLFFCLAFSAGIQVLKFFEPGRYPDLTDLILALLGSLIGIWFVRRFAQK